MPVKKRVSKAINKKPVIASEAKQSSQGKNSTKIASSPEAPRNDKKVSARVSLSVPVYSLAGRADGTLTLPKEIFGQKVNKKLLSQAMRVYMTNQKNLTGFTKTRGEVEGSTAKIYRQKGTGRARHGGIRAPIFVGGGIVFGPKPRKVKLELPQRMKKAALLSAFSFKVTDKNIIGLAGIEKASGKTKEIVKLMLSVKKQDNASALIVTGDKTDNAVRAVRNIPGVDILPVNLINAYEVVKHDLLLITKEAVEKLSKPVKGQK